MKARWGTAAAAALALALLGAGCGSDAPAEREAGAKANEGTRVAKQRVQEDGGPPFYEPKGKLVADVGFRPEKDGFGFENYTFGFQDLGPAEMEAIFGERVCAARQSSECQLSPAAQAWMDEANKFIKGGHCYGMAVTAEMMFDRLLSPLDYGGAAVPQLSLIGNARLQTQIARAWALQATPKIQLAKFGGTPNQLLDKLTEALKSHEDTYTLTFWQPDWTAGHAVTPYAVEDKGGGQFAVLMYDNNYPKITRAMEFDRNANTWQYEASPNPGEDSFLYKGDANTKTQYVSATKTHVGVQPCPFCPRPAGARERAYEQVTLSGDSINHSHLLLTDSRGRRTGYVGDRLVQEIPGVIAAPVITNQNWRLKMEPIYLVPAGLKYKITVDGSRLGAPDAEALSVIGPGYDAVLSDLEVRPGERHSVTVRAGATRLAYRAPAGRAHSPDIELGFQKRKFTVATHKLERGATLTASVDPSRGLVVSGPTSTRGHAVVGQTTLRPSGREVTRRRVVRLGGRR